jgi:hypothetical protein
MNNKLPISFLCISAIALASNLAFAKPDKAVAKADRFEIEAGDINSDGTDELVFFEKSSGQISVAGKKAGSEVFSVDPKMTGKVEGVFDKLFVSEGTGDKLQDIILSRPGSNEVHLIDIHKISSNASKSSQLSPEVLGLFTPPESRLYFQKEGFALFHRVPHSFWQTGKVEQLREIAAGKKTELKPLMFGRKEYPPKTFTWNGKLHLGYYVYKKGLFGMKAADGSSGKLVLDIDRRDNVLPVDLDRDGFSEIIAWNNGENCLEISYFGNRFEGIMPATRKDKVCLTKKGKPEVLEEQLELMVLRDKQDYILTGVDRDKGEVKMFLKGQKDVVECATDKKQDVKIQSCELLSSLKL